MLAHNYTTGREIYEEAWMRARYLLNFTHTKFFDDPDNFWWNQFKEDDIRSEAILLNRQLMPFVIKFVKNVSADSQKCSYCSNPRCAGCLLDPSSSLKIYEIL
jgi:hypothetical protein